MSHPSQRRFLPVILVLMATATAVLCAQEDLKPTDKPLLWKIQGPAAVSYLYGTVHVPDKRVLVLPESVQQAVDSSDAFYAEVPMEQMGKLAAHVLLPEGETLQQILPEDLYQRASDYMKSKNMTLTVFNRFKIWVLVAQLTLLDYMHELANHEPLDLALYSRARKAGKEVGGLETIEEQLDVFESLTREEQINLLSDTLDQLQEQTPDGLPFIEKLIQLYLEGDPVKIANFMDFAIDASDPVDVKFAEKLLDQRDRRMADRMAEKLRSRPDKSFFFAIGAGHLYSKTGVVKLLREKGFELGRIVEK